MDLSLQTILYRLVAMLIIVGVHGFAVALVASALGAKDPQYDGRLTLNPLVHLDLVAIIPFLLFQIGWIRPIAVDETRLRGGRNMIWLVALVGLMLTLAAVVLLWLARPSIVSFIPNVAAASATTTIIRVLLEMTTWFVIVNLIPIAPLTMGTALRTLSKPLANFVQRHELYVRIVLILLAALAAVSVLRPVFDAVLKLVSLGRS